MNILKSNRATSSVRRVSAAVALRAAIVASISIISLWLVLPVSAATQKLKVHSNGRFLVKEDDTYFHWNGDTSWWLYRLSDEDVLYYLNDRAAKGFNVIQGPHIYNKTNVYEQQPYFNGDETKPNEAYFQRLDKLINEADSRGMYVVLQVMWAQDAVNFTTSSAHTFGQWLGNRYKNKNNIIWSTTGEYQEAGSSRYPIFQAVAEGLQAGHSGNHLITVHPGGNQTSSNDWQNASWLNFNMIQSGQKASTSAWTLVESDYARTPVKPTLNAEAWYEGSHPSAVSSSLDTRKAAYWSVFAGGFGHTYGSMGIWDIASTWKSDLSRPGAAQMRHLNNLIQSRPQFSRVPDQGVLASAVGSSYKNRLQATRALDGKYAFVYIPTSGTSVSINMNKISGGTVSTWWYSPRDGAFSAIGEYSNSGVRTFTTPSSGPDWILVLDDKSQKFLPPGALSIFEMESLGVAKVSSGAVAKTENQSNASAGAVKSLIANAVGDYIICGPVAVEAGTFNLKVRVKKYPNRGIMEVAHAFEPNDTSWQVWKSPQDLYASGSQYVDLDLGKKTFTSSGMRYFRFKVKGSNSQSQGYKLAIDALKLIRQ